MSEEKLQETFDKLEKNYLVSVSFRRWYSILVLVASFVCTEKISFNCRPLYSSGINDIAESASSL
jgi:hypothetical protein